MAQFPILGRVFRLRVELLLLPKSPFSVMLLQRWRVILLQTVSLTMLWELDLAGDAIPVSRNSIAGPRKLRSYCHRVLSLSCYRGWLTCDVVLYTYQCVSLTGPAE